MVKHNTNVFFESKLKFAVILESWNFFSQISVNFFFIIIFFLCYCYYYFFFFILFNDLI